MRASAGPGAVIVSISNLETAVKYVVWPLIAALFWLSSAQFALGQGYARPELLVETIDLAKAPKIWVVLDVRTRKKFEASHVPGALWVDHGSWVKAFGAGKNAAAWSKRIGELGIRPDSVVVLYDDTGVKDAAQIWWILRFWGMERARLLNGGWNAWKKEERPLEKGPGQRVESSAIVVKAKTERIATMESVLSIVKDKRQTLIDARSEGEFVGTEKFAKRVGAIPGAIHLDWVELLDPRTQRFRSAAELDKLFRDAGVNPQAPATAYCQSGRRSSVTVFALELLGNNQARNYFASWLEWGNDDDTPIEPGKAQKR